MSVNLTLAAQATTSVNVPINSANNDGNATQTSHAIVVSPSDGVTLSSASGAANSFDFDDSTANASSEYEIAATGLTAGTTYTFTVTSEVAGANVETAITYKTPSLSAYPAAPTMNDAGVVSWTAPVMGNAVNVLTDFTMTSQQLQVKIGSADYVVVTGSVTSDATSYNFGDYLVAGETYQFKLFGNDGSANLAPQESDVYRVAKASAYPSAPVMTAVGVVSWTTPVMGNDINVLTNFSMASQQASQQLQVKIGGADYADVVGGVSANVTAYTQSLVDGETYQFKLFGNDGSADLAPQESIVYRADKASAYPAAPTWTSDGAAVTVSWTAPIMGNATNTTANFTMASQVLKAYNATNNNEEATYTVAQANDASIMIPLALLPNLANGAYLKFEIVGNDGSATFASAKSLALPLFSRPAKASEFTGALVLSATENNKSITVTVPAYTLGNALNTSVDYAIKSMSVSYHSNDAPASNALTMFLDTSSGTTVSLNGLIPGKTYNVTLIGENNDGTKFRAAEAVLLPRAAVVSSYESLTADITGLVSSVKLSWEHVGNSANTIANTGMASQSIYYTDVYQSGDGGEINDNKVIDIDANDRSLTITGLSGLREYDFVLQGTDNNGLTIVKRLTVVPNQPAPVPEFTLKGGNKTMKVIISNHNNSIAEYIIFINGVITQKVHTIGSSDLSQDSITKDWYYIFDSDDGIVNSIQGKPSNYEVSLRSVNAISKSPMSGSVNAEATDLLPPVAGLKVLTGVGIPAGNSSQAVVKFDAVEDAIAYKIQAFAVDSDKTAAVQLDEMIATTNNWSSTTNLHYNMTGLTIGTEYYFAVVPVGEGPAVSYASLAYVKGTPASEAGSAGNLFATLTGGRDISGGTVNSVANELTFAQMDGKLKLDWNISKDHMIALGNGLPVTALTFDLSGADENDVTKQIVVSDMGSDLSGSVMFSGLKNGDKFTLNKSATNALGGADATEMSAEHYSNTRPSNFTAIATPLVGEQDTGFDICANMLGNGLTVSLAEDSSNFVFDISGLNAGSSDLFQEGMSKATLKGLYLVDGNRYQIKARGLNRNGGASPAEIVQIIKPSAPPAVAMANGDPADDEANMQETRIHLRTTTTLNKLVLNLSNMRVAEYGYATTGARVKAVYVVAGSNEAWESEWKIVTDLSKDFEMNLPPIVNTEDPHTNYTLHIQPFNAVYGKDYQVEDAENSVPGYPKAMKSGLNTHITPTLNVTSTRLGLSELRMTTDLSDLSTHMVFRWHADSAAANNVEILVASKALNTNQTAHAPLKHSDYQLIKEMSSIKYEPAVDGDEEQDFMTYDMSGSDDIENTIQKYIVGRKIHFLVREKAHPENFITMSHVIMAVPTITDLAFGNYKSRDLITFKIKPNGAKISTLFLLNNLNTEGQDFFFNILDTTDIPESTATKLENQIGTNDIIVSIQKSKFNLESVPTHAFLEIVSGNSAGVTLADSTKSFTDLTDRMHPNDVALYAKQMAEDAELLAANALTLAAKINGQVSNSNSIKAKNADDVMVSPADTQAQAVLAKAKLALDQYDAKALHAIQGISVDSTEIDLKIILKAVYTNTLTQFTALQQLDHAL
mgnify:CR=1 FL=1|tara:strand:+ start:579 stop:5339 length:4761 start_codon:yes stop_codon:yes gene_type:complete